MLLSVFNIFLHRDDDDNEGLANFHFLLLLLLHLSGASMNSFVGCIVCCGAPSLDNRSVAINYLLTKTAAASAKTRDEHARAPTACSWTSSPVSQLDKSLLLDGNIFMLATHCSSSSPPPPCSVQSGSIVSIVHKFVQSTIANQCSTSRNVRHYSPRPRRQRRVSIWKMLSNARISSVCSCVFSIWPSGHSASHRGPWLMLVDFVLLCCHWCCCCWSWWWRGLGCP